MSTVVLFEKDPFVAALSAEAVFLGTRHMVSSGQRVRRPLVGMEARGDVYSYLSVYSEIENQHISLMDQGQRDGSGTENTNFLIQSVQERHMEKTQIVQTFGDNYYFFFGKEPEFVMVSGLLLMARDFNWANEFRYNYEHFFRGTKCAENRTRVQFSYDTVLVQGMVISMALDYNSGEPFLVPCTFNIAVTDTIDKSVTAAKDGAASEESREYRYASRRIALIADAEDQYITGTEYPAHVRQVLSGIAGSSPDQPMMYNNNGKLVASSRKQGSDGEPQKYLSRDQALLELDVRTDGTLETDTGLKLFKARSIGSFRFASRATALALSSTLETGQVAASGAVIA
jgi:hypothetical protein